MWEFHSGGNRSVTTTQNCLKSGYGASLQKKRNSLKISCYCSDKKINGLRTGNSENNRYILDDATAVIHVVMWTIGWLISCTYESRKPGIARTQTYFQQWSSTLLISHFGAIISLIFDKSMTYFSGLLVLLWIGTRKAKDNVSGVHLSKLLMSRAKM